MQSPLIVKVGPFCRKGLSPPGEPWCRHMLHGGKACCRTAMRFARGRRRRDLTNCTQGRDKSRSPLRQGGPSAIHTLSPGTRMELIALYRRWAEGLVFLVG